MALLVETPLQRARDTGEPGTCGFRPGGRRDPVIRQARRPGSGRPTRSPGAGRKTLRFQFHPSDTSSLHPSCAGWPAAPPARPPSGEPGSACRNHREPASPGAGDKHRAKGKENPSEQRKGRQRSLTARPPGQRRLATPLGLSAATYAPLTSLPPPTPARRTSPPLLAAGTTPPSRPRRDVRSSGCSPSGSAGAPDYSSRRASAAPPPARLLLVSAVRK